MLSFFRRLINSKTGIVVTFIILGVIALAFAAGDVTGLRGGTGPVGGGDVAKIGGTSVSATDLKTRVSSALDAARQQQPTATMTQLLAQGAFESILDQLVNSMALAEFGHDQGLVASKKSVDGVIASIPGLQGPTGKFDPQIYQRLLAERKLTDAQVRDDIARDTIGQQLVLPTVGATQIAQQLATPYAALLLEHRQGEVAFVPSAALAGGAAPTDAELQTFYARNVARYTVPERRVIRYALVTAAAMKAQATPTDAELAQAYQQQRSRFAASFKRDVSQVVAPDQAGANAIAAKIKGGSSASDAARAAGLEASVQKAVEKPGYAASTSAAIADAVFAAPSGATVGPIKGPLGWTVAHVDAVTAVAAKTLEQARPDLLPALTQQKAQVALGSIHDAIDDALSANATFDETVADRKLAATTTEPITAAGINPDKPDAKADPALAQIVAAGFQAADGDAPQMVQTGADGSFALVGVGRIVPAAPRPLAQVREAVARDFGMERARAAARVLANQIVAKASKGMPLGAAIAAAGRSLPPVRPLAAARAQIAANPRQAPPPLVLMFSMAQGNAKLLEAPQQSGWYVVKLDRIVAGNAATQPGVIAATRRDLGQSVGREYVEQFVKAIRASLGTKVDAAAVARAKADLSGAGGQGG